MNKPGLTSTPLFTEVKASFEEINTAIIRHSKWLTEWTTRIICNIPVDPPYMTNDSHKECYFGRWYYGEHANFLIHKKEFIELEELHQLVHIKMRSLATKANNKETVSREEYTQFIDSEAHFSESIIRLRDNIYQLLLSFDYLTGTLNRQAFFHILEQELARISRTGEHSCVVLLDIDNFKSVNDEFGHTAGDQVLVTLSDFIIKSIRPYDSICRYGGEEFLICMTNSSINTAENIIERIREQLSQIEIPVAADKLLSVSASFGIASMMPDIEIEKIIERADLALYQAKKQGRNKVEIWENIIS